MLRRFMNWTCAAYEPYRRRTETTSALDVRRRSDMVSALLLAGWLAAAPDAHADTISEWNLITARTLEISKAGTGLAHSRVYAMVHGAMFDAVNAIERRYDAYAGDLEAPAGASPDAAAAVAAYTVLVDL